MATPVDVGPGAEPPTISLTDPSSAAVIREIGRRRLRMSLLLTAIVLAVWLGFILLVAFAKSLLAIEVANGLTLALVLAAAAIVVGWLLSLFYVVWANSALDTAVKHVQ